jgi:hypothetical protein
VAIEVLGKYQPNLHLCFEDYRAENLLRFYDPKWRTHFPGLTPADVKEFERLAGLSAERFRRGECMGLEEYPQLPWGEKEREQSYRAGAAYAAQASQAAERSLRS